MKTMIEVTQDHISRGERGKGCKCPVALAIQENTGAGFVFVYPDNVEIGKTSMRCVYVDLTKAATKFVVAFDAGKPVSPFRFQLQY